METPISGVGKQGMSFLREPHFGVCFLLCPYISRSPWGSHHGWVTRPWRCFGEDASPCSPQGSIPQRHTSVSPWDSVESAWPRAQRRLQGIRKETNSSPAPECGFSLSQPPSGASLFIASLSSLPSWEQAPGCFLPPQGPGVLGHSLPLVLSSPASFRGY